MVQLLLTRLIHHTVSKERVHGMDFISLRLAFVGLMTSFILKGKPIKNSELFHHGLGHS